jgi:hypothetical protein
VATQLFQERTIEASELKAVLNGRPAAQLTHDNENAIVHNPPPSMI